MSFSSVWDTIKSWGSHYGPPSYGDDLFDDNINKWKTVYQAHTYTAPNTGGSVSISGTLSNIPIGITTPGPGTVGNTKTVTITNPWGQNPNGWTYYEPQTEVKDSSLKDLGPTPVCQRTARQKLKDKLQNNKECRGPDQRKDEDIQDTILRHEIVCKQCKRYIGNGGQV